MLELKQRMDELDRLATCPTFRQPMDAQHKRQLADELKLEGAAARYPAQ
jgi:hypothetical protein